MSADLAEPGAVRGNALRERRRLTDCLSYTALTEIVHVCLVRHDIESVAPTSPADIADVESAVDEPLGDEDLSGFEDHNIRMGVFVDG